jgi:hypothetical protein
LLSAFLLAAAFFVAALRGDADFRGRTLVFGTCRLGEVSLQKLSPAMGNLDWHHRSTGPVAAVFGADAALYFGAAHPERNR